LFDMVLDPGETKDIRADHPEVMEEMLSEYDVFAQESGILDMPAGYNSQKAVLSNAMARMMQNYWWILAIAAGGLILFMYACYRLVRKIWRSS